MLSFAFYVQQAAVAGGGVGISWEGVRTVMTALTTAGIIGTLRMMVSMRDDVRDMKGNVGNEAAGTGLMGHKTKIESRVAKIENRNLRLDAIYADYVRDLEEHDGSERRHSGKKLRASLRATLEDENNT